ncbi:MAG: hypothetical protein LBI72_02500 [Flavobacteriaceae bacterium]|jgi:hypothetical protein|nr:hypothetical protein [Flavobacteriaceae bacterium]
MGKLRQILCLVLLMTISVSIGQTVQYNTKIKDGTVGASSQMPTENSILELESTTKGFLMPRLTKAQIDDIPAATLQASGNGLVVYNVDTNCINYYSQATSMWMSLCGTLPPAVIDINSTACSKILLVNSKDGSNQLKQGEFLTTNDILYVDIQVNNPGTYDIAAITDNGYYFSGSGTFMGTGTMRIPLEGVGIPIKGYDTPTDGDQLKFTINGKESVACSSFKIHVAKAGIQFNVVCGSGFTAVGSYMLGIPVTPSENKVEIDVNVTELGAYSVSTNVVNGVSFSGSGTFTTKGNQKITLYAEGVPTTAGTFSLNTKTNSNGATNPVCTINVTVLGVDASVDLSKSVKSGSFVKGEKLTTKNTITVEVKVNAPGKADFSIVADGVTFKADNVVLNWTKGAANIQKVTLNAPVNTTLPDKASLVFKGTNTATVKYTSEYTVVLESPPVNYTIDCSTIKVHGNLIPGVGANSSNNKVTLDVIVSQPGLYTIYTNVINGVGYFSIGGSEFLTPGRHSVTLEALGTPEKALKGIQYIININSVKADATCSFTVDVKMNDFSILVLGKEEFSIGKVGSDAYKLLKSSNNFGPNGKVKVNNINVETYKKISFSTTADATELGTKLNQSKIDLLMIMEGAKIEGAALNVLVDYINNAKGVVIYSTGDIKETSSVLKVIKDISNASTTGTYLFGTLRYAPITNVSNALTSTTEFGTITNKHFGLDGMFSTNITQVNAYMNPIAVDSGSGDMWVAQHKTKGFVFVGDGSWTYSGIKSTTRGPFGINALGEPVAVKNYGGKGGKDVYNSTLFANMIKWAIEYRTQNK